MIRQMYKVIELVGGGKAVVCLPFKYQKCNGCDANDIFWVKTVAKQKNMPVHHVEGKGFLSHFADCPGLNNSKKENV